MATVLLAGTVVLSGAVIASGDGDHALSSSSSTSSPLTGIDLNETLGLYTLTTASAPFRLTDVEPMTIIGPTEDVDGNPLTWSYQVTDGSLEDVTVSQSSNSFTITTGLENTSFTIQFTAQDGNGNSVSLVSSFTYISTAAAQGSFFASAAMGPLLGGLGNTYEGAVWVYNLSDLSSPTILSVPDDLEYGFFGRAVAFSDNKLFVVRSGGEPSERGVFVYETSDLSAAPTFLPAQNQTFDEQLSSISAKGNRVFVGTKYGYGDTSTQSGAIYVYNADDLTEAPIKLLSNRGADRFGWNSRAIGVTTDKVIIGAYSADQPSSNQGELNIFNLNDLSQAPIHFAPSLVDDADQFGYTVVADDTLVVASSRNDNSAKGSIWVFPSNDISNQSAINYQPADGQSSDYFGQHMALHDNYLIVASPYDDDNADMSGSVYIYNRSDLSTQPIKLLSPNAHASQRFGRSLEVAGDSLFVGSADNDEVGYQSGSVYVYNLNDLTEAPTRLKPSELRNNSEFSQATAGYSYSS